MATATDNKLAEALGLPLPGIFRQQARALLRHAKETEKAAKADIARVAAGEEPRTRWTNGPVEALVCAVEERTKADMALQFDDEARKVMK